LHSGRKRTFAKGKSKRIVRAAIGAGAGIAAVGAVHVAARGTRDIYGERSRNAKLAEKAPVFAGVATAAVLAHNRSPILKRATKFVKNTLFEKPDKIGKRRTINLDSRRDSEERLRDRLDIAAKVTSIGAGAAGIVAAGRIGRAGVRAIKAHQSQIKEAVSAVVANDSNSVIFTKFVRFLHFLRFFCRRARGR
jgi:hypothetical protein